MHRSLSPRTRARMNWSVLSSNEPVSDEVLRGLLGTLSPLAREHLRTVLVRDQADRDAIASSLLRYRDERGTPWANSLTNSRSIPSSDAGTW